MVKNARRIVWEKKDFLKHGIVLFFEYLVLMSLIFVAIVIRNNGFENFNIFFSKQENIKGVVFSGIAVALLIIVTFIYFYNINGDFIYKISNQFMIYAIITVSVIANYAFGLVNIYLRPISLCCLLMLFVTEKKTAVFMNIVFASYMIVVDFLLYESNALAITSMAITFITGTFAVFLVDGKTSRFKVLLMGGFIAIPVMLASVGIEFSFTDNLVYAFGSGVLTNVLFIVILPFIEILFGAVTNFRLSELTDHKTRLIKNLIATAPGTFNHTIVIATMAEACSNAIGENPMLARACAYYHDVGKLKNPEYFAENQTDVNLHDDLSPELSTDIIKSHAKDGAELIRKRRLPSILADIAEQHHGTMPIKYFYAKAKKFTDGQLDMDDFCYQGPKPQTKIAAIIMICDASEAKVRTISNRNHEAVDKAVREIIEERMDLEQFTECDITLRELDIIRHTITSTLAGVYHGRVKYPKLKVGKKNAN